FEGKKSINYLKLYSNLCIHYKATQTFHYAEENFKRLIRLIEEANMVSNKIIIDANYNLSSLYIDNNLYEQAEFYISKNLKIASKIFDTISIDYGNALMRYALFYKVIGQRDLAIEYYNKCINICEKLNSYDQLYYMSVHNLANILKTENFGKADELFRKTLSIVKAKFGSGHIDYYTALTSLAHTYVDHGNYDTARIMIYEAVKHSDSTFGKSSAQYLFSLGTCAYFHFRIGEYDLAKTYYARIDSSLNAKKTLIYDNSDIKSEFIQCYDSTGNSYIADELRERKSKFIKHSVNNAIKFMSNKELEIFSSDNISWGNSLLDNIFTRKDVSPLMNQVAFDFSLFSKGLLLNAQLKLRNKLESDPVLNEQYNQYKSLNNYKAKLELSSDKNPEYLMIIDSMRKLEKALARSAQWDENSYTQDHWDQVRRALRKNELLIDFSNYKKNERVYYIAFIISKSLAYPQCVQICSEEEVLKFYNEDSISNKVSRVNSMYSYNIQGNLFNLLFGKLNSYLNSETKIYISPTRFLSMVNFNALPVNEYDRVMDKYSIEIISSSLNLVKEDNEIISKKNTAMLFGGIDYALVSNIDYTKQAVEDYTLSAKRSMSYSLNSTRDTLLAWTPLPATELEVQRVSVLLQKHQYNTTVLNGSKASEEICKKFNGSINSPEILHFATHAYLYENKIIQNSIKSLDDRIANSTDPMVRSVLILSNANIVWKDGRLSDALQEDGILTALEISQLSLRNTDLVVLSACETGLGEIKLPHEGVYGLQRAFKIAGVKSILMTLWKVDDKETSELVYLFYKNWKVKNISKSRALVEAQKELSNKGRSPYHWAGFVLVE
ncbi:MAG: CHAT domain-containing protein, partial [Saprospiraceae bacterium]|nr:CHAT domain-containing protein [Saprospiraceae bacterium]